MKKTTDKMTHTPSPLDPHRLKMALIGEYFTAEQREFIVRAVNSHQGLIMALRETARMWHERVSHEGYFHNCGVPICRDNKEILIQAKGK